MRCRIKSDLRERLFNHILNLGPAYTRGQRTGELTTAAVEGIEALDAYYSQYLPQLVITALIPISILIVVFPLDLLSGIVMLVTAPLIPFFMIMIGKGAEIVTKRQYQTLSRLSAHFLDSLQGLTTLKLFGQSKAHAKNIEKVSDQFRDTTLSVLRITFLSALALELLATLSTAVIAVEIGFRLLYARMEFHEAFFILILAPEFYLPLRMLGARFHAGMSGTTAARRIFEILDTPVTSDQLFSDQQSASEPVSLRKKYLPLNLKMFQLHLSDETTAALGKYQPDKSKRATYCSGRRKRRGKIHTCQSSARLYSAHTGADQHQPLSHLPISTLPLRPSPGCPNDPISSTTRFPQTFDLANRMQRTRK